MNTLSLATRALPFGIPVILTVLITVFVYDPSYRYPLLAMLLPSFQLAAAVYLGRHHNPPRLSRIGWLLQSLSFAAMIVGWSLVFAIISFTLAVGVFSLESTPEVMKRSMLAGQLAYLVSAWFWWPFYVKHVVADWPTHQVRIFVKASSQWEQLFRTYRMQQMSELGTIRWIGFLGVCGLVFTLTMLTAIGAYSGLMARTIELMGCVLLLPILHLIVVQQAGRLCDAWGDVKQELDA